MQALMNARLDGRVNNPQTLKSMADEIQSQRDKTWLSGPVWRSGADHRTNNQAEMFALLAAIKAVPLGTSAAIFSDSQVAIGAATTWRTGWERRGMRTASGDPVKNQDLVRRLWEELDKRPGLIRLEWVKGHAGNEGNEIVDQLANDAAEAVKAGGKPAAKTVTRELAA